LASTESEASTAASSGKASLLFRLLRHMTIINEHNRDGNGDVRPGIRLSTGVYAVPLSATQMLQVCECGYVVVFILFIYDHVFELAENCHFVR
jgi:hypothetical protein